MRKIIALTFVGLLLVWLPVLAPVLFSAVRFAQSGHFLFDYLMPAELFPLALAGGGLLVWAAVRARLHRKCIGWGLGVAIASLVCGQLLALVTGLASGESEPAGLPWALLVSSLVIYSLSLVFMGICGILLLHTLFTKRT